MGKLLGLDEATGNFRSIRAVLHSYYAVSVFKDGAQVVADLAALKAPYRTGELAESIKARGELRKGNPSALVTTNKVPYASFVEFGDHRQAAEPYMRPAADESHDEVTAVIGEGMRALIEGAIT